MLELILILLPFLFALISLCMPQSSRLPRRLLLVAAILQTAGCTLLLFEINCPLFPDWVESDIPGLTVASIAAVLFLGASIHINLWLDPASVYEVKHGIPMRESLFCALLLAFLSMMTLVSFSHNLGLLWVAVEATTLFSAPLIIYHRSKTSLEAMWKYLLICSVGIGLALFGTYLICIAFSPAAGLNLKKLVALAEQAQPVWYRAGFLFCFVGYGLKMGLAPFHTWLPDAHSESPSSVSLLLSGALLNCSFLGLFRIISIAPSAQRLFCNEILIIFGLLSLAVAAFFMISQHDFKRMLAYSSVEHMGLLAIFLGLNIQELMFLHMAFHSFCKMILFLLAGNYLLAFGTRKIDLVQGTFKSMHRTAFLWFAGIALICGMPPSPLFLTEIGLVMFSGPYLSIVILFLLFIVFAAMTHIAMKMTTGPENAHPEDDAARTAEKLSFLPALMMIFPVLAGCLLIYIIFAGGIL